MFKSFREKVFSYGINIANIGVLKNLGFYEKTKTQVMNIVVASGLPVNAFFFIINFIAHKPLLAIINLLLFAGGILILMINSYGKFLLARLLLTFLACIVFSASAILFRNGSEYYLIVNLIIVIIYFNQKKYLIGFSILSCLLFLFVKLVLHSSFVFDALSFGRVVFNIIWALMIMTLALLFFKTEQLTYQKQIEEKNIELQKLNDTKEKLFSIIAHDLRSPIGLLKNSLDLVEKEFLSPEKFQEISLKLSFEVGQLHSTLDNLLRWSSSQLHGIQVNPEKIALTPVLQKKISFFKKKIEQKNLTFQLESNGQIVYVDPDHLLLVLRNLISNAIKFSYPGSIIYIRSYTKDGQVVIQVADTGTGMTDELKNAVLDSESMISNPGTAKEKGTGLGLKLCREFIEKNNGTIWVESVEKKGSTFYVSFPEAT